MMKNKKMLTQVYCREKPDQRTERDTRLQPLHIPFSSLNSIEKQVERKLDSYFKGCRPQLRRDSLECMQLVLDEF